MFPLIPTPAASALCRHPSSRPFPFCWSQWLQGGLGGFLPVLDLSQHEVGGGRTAEDVPHRPHHPVLRVKPPSPGGCRALLWGPLRSEGKAGAGDGQRDGRGAAHGMRPGDHHPLLIVPTPKLPPTPWVLRCTLAFTGWRSRFETPLLNSPHGQGRKH